MDIYIQFWMVCIDWACTRAIFKGKVKVLTIFAVGEAVTEAGGPRYWRSRLNTKRSSRMGSLIRLIGGAQWDTIGVVLVERSRRVGVLFNSVWVCWGLNMKRSWLGNLIVLASGAHWDTSRGGLSEWCRRVGVLLIIICVCWIHNWDSEFVKSEQEDEADYFYYKICFNRDNVGSFLDGSIQDMSRK